MQYLPDKIRPDARHIIRAASRIVVLTGAGVSAESGVPTFRGDGGLWKSCRAEDLATPEAFARDPRLVWEWYAWRREIVARCSANAAHHAIAKLAATHPETLIVTQNVDGLHSEAAAALGEPGSAPAMPLELHGSLFVIRCTRCAWRRPHREPIDATLHDTLPRCESCGALARPAVVWFGELLNQTELERAFDAARAADVCLVVGTSAVVQPAASIALATLEGGGAIVEVNPTETPLSPHALVSLRDRAALALPDMLL
jgi:NAD-dependent deacetylase